MSKLNEKDYPGGYPAKVPSCDAADETGDATVRTEYRAQGEDFNHVRAVQERVARALGARGMFAVYPGDDLQHVAIQGGYLDYNAVHYTVDPAAAMALEMSATNYIYMDVAARTFGLTTTGFPSSGAVQLAQTECDGAGMLMDSDGDPIITDRRPAFVKMSPRLTTILAGAGIRVTDLGGGDYEIVNSGVLEVVAGSGIQITSTGQTRIIARSATGTGGGDEAYLAPCVARPESCGCRDVETWDASDYDSTEHTNWMGLDTAGAAKNRYVYFRRELPPGFTKWNANAIQIRFWADNNGANTWLKIRVHRNDVEVMAYTEYKVGVLSTWETITISDSDIASAWEAGDMLRITFLFRCDANKEIRMGRISFDMG